MAQLELAVLSNGASLGAVRCSPDSVHALLGSEIPANSRRCGKGAGNMAARRFNGRSRTNSGFGTRAKQKKIVPESRGADRHHTACKERQGFIMRPADNFLQVCSSARSAPAKPFRGSSPQKRRQ